MRWKLTANASASDFKQPNLLIPCNYGLSESLSLMLCLLINCKLFRGIDLRFFMHLQSDYFPHNALQKSSSESFFSISLSKKQSYQLNFGKNSTFSFTNISFQKKKLIFSSFISSKLNSSIKQSLSIIKHHNVHDLLFFHLIHKYVFISHFCWAWYNDKKLYLC